MLVGVIVVVQLVELAVYCRRRAPRSPVPWRDRRHRRTPRSPASAVGFQLLLPSMLFPDNGDSAGVHRRPDRRLSRGVLTEQLGLGQHPAIGALILAARGRRHGRRVHPPARASTSRWPPLTVLSAIAVSTHFRMVGRYYFQIAPWVLYFAAVAVVAAVRRSCWRSRDRRCVAVVRRACRCCTSSPSTSPCCPATSATSQRLRPRRARSRSARPTRASRPIFDAVAGAHRARRRHRLLPGPHDDAVHRPPDDPDDRTSTASLQRADYFAQLRGSDYYQPRHRRRPRPTRSGWSRSGRTTAGSSGGCREPDDVTLSAGDDRAR